MAHQHASGSRDVHAHVSRIVQEESSYDDACQRLLHLLRQHVGMQVAWTSEFVGTHQVFRFVDAAPGSEAPAVGTATP